jgi:hypothetical protein
MLQKMFRLGMAVNLSLLLVSTGSAAVVTGEVVDSATHEPVAARLYIQNQSGDWFFAESIGGTAIRYANTNWVNPRSMEVHVSLSAHPFRVELPPGQYTFTTERGKEYHPLSQQVVVADEPLTLKIALQRWVNMASRGWFSGDGHVHRSLAELPTLLLAEDLNVALPETYWVREAFAPPTSGDKNSEVKVPAELIKADATHVIWPRNTEYEITTVGGKDHNLGAVLILNHHEPFTLGAPPMRPVAEAAHRQGALLDLDKCNWAWTMMLVPVMKIDLCELANNQMWRTDFAFTNFTIPAPAFMNVPDAGRSGGERDWINYTLGGYYALLDCGFRLRPTAGSASGVHPVPLGFGRVYVYCPKGFSYDNWIKGLGEGRSFVTTGPMLLAKINGEVPGGQFKLAAGKARKIELTGTVVSETPVQSIEVLVNGAVKQTISLHPKLNPAGAYEASFEDAVKLTGTSWVALRCWESLPNDRIRFANTAPSWFDDATVPLHPRKEEVAWLIERMKEQIKFNTGVLPPAAVAEYQQALAIYQELEKGAR